MAVLPVHRAIADAMSDSAKLGQAVAKGSSQTFQLPQTSPDGQTMTLFPGTGKDMAIGTSQLFPESANGQPSDFTSLYGNDNGTVAAGFNAQSVLNAEASRTGQAYQTLAHSANRSHPDLSNDPIWKTTDYVMDNYSLFAKTFADCTSITSYHDSQFDAKLHDYKTCVRGPKPPSSCTYVHNWEVAPMVEPVSGPTKVEKCGEGCIDVWVGQIGDNYWNAACAFFEASSVYNVVSPDAITDAKLEAVYWDDYIQVFVDGHNVFDTHPNIFHCDAHPPNLRFVLFPFTDVTGLLKTKGHSTP
jgi:conjugal transfer mating pair stabilization protein TraN